MRGKLSKLIRKYVDSEMVKDLRKIPSQGRGQIISNRPDYVIKQKLKNINWIERSRFIQEMKQKVSGE
jgi:hypothetical protein